jgi:hypothetical protein
LEDIPKPYHQRQRRFVFNNQLNSSFVIQQIWKTAQKKTPKEALVLQKILERFCILNQDWKSRTMIMFPGQPDRH